MLFNRIFRIANYSNESSYSQVWQGMSIIPALRKQKLGKLGFEAGLGYTQQKQRQGEEGDLCSLVVSKIFFVFSLFGILSYCIYSLSFIIIVFMCSCTYSLCRPDCPGICWVDQADFEFSPGFAFDGLGSKAYATMPSLSYAIFEKHSMVNS